MKDCKNLEIPDVKVMKPYVLEDHRGYFLESYNAQAYGEAGITGHFVQDNQSLSRIKGTVRGMHFQIPPFAQAKLVRVLQGSILDVAFDLRSETSTYQQWCSAVITAEDHNQIFIPAGFAHGFITLAPETIVHYKVDNHYSKEHERGFIWNDRDAQIEWGAFDDEVALSDKDKLLPELKDLPVYF